VAHLVTPIANALSTAVSPVVRFVAPLATVIGTSVAPALQRLTFTALPLSSVASPASAAMAQTLGLSVAGLTPASGVGGSPPVGPATSLATLPASTFPAASQAGPHAASTGSLASGSRAISVAAAGLLVSVGSLMAVLYALFGAGGGGIASLLESTKTLMAGGGFRTGHAGRAALGPLPLSPAPCNSPAGGGPAAGGGSGGFFFGTAALPGAAGSYLPRVLCALRIYGARRAPQPFISLLERPG
jgi:hypothetical protein